MQLRAGFAAVKLFKYPFFLFMITAGLKSIQDGVDVFRQAHDALPPFLDSSKENKTYLQDIKLS